MKSILILLFISSFGLINAQIIEQPFEDSTAHLFVIEGAPFDKFQPQGDELLLAMSDGGDYITFVLKRMSKEPFFLKIIEFSSEQMEVQFFNYAKMYGMPTCVNDTITFMFEMPYRTSQYTFYFALEKTGSKYTGVKFVSSDYEDLSADALQKAEEALEANDIAKAVDQYHAVMYPQYYMNEKEVGCSLMKKAHKLALNFFKAGDYKNASINMAAALSYYENASKLEFKSTQEMNEELADTSTLIWNLKNFKLWLGDYGLFLYKAKDYEASITINSYLNKVMPLLAGPYLQLGDTYYDMGKKAEAVEPYKKYAKEMKEQKKDKLIPKRVKERIKGK
jgi:tetratricopeptide (TPR) repeat protein